MQVEGGVTAAKGFKAAGIYGGLRAKGEKPDLALVACDVGATVAGKECDSMRLCSSNHCKSYLNVPFAC
jgi:N-acetylglutamate synthase/N-acetylornithine aminotransferase